MGRKPKNPPLLLDDVNDYILKLKSQVATCDESTQSKINEQLLLWYEFTKTHFKKTKRKPRK